MTLPQAAAAIGIHKQTAWRWVCSGRLVPSVVSFRGKPEYRVSRAEVSRVRAGYRPRRKRRVRA